MKKPIFALICIFLSLVSFSGEVPGNSAAEVAQAFYQQHYQSFFGVFPGNFVIKETLKRTADGKILFYIFNLDPSGFIIVSADDAVKPVLGYSFEGQCDDINGPPSYMAWMEQFSGEIRALRNSPSFNPGSRHPEWNKYSQKSPETKLPVAGISPLLTCNWNQNAPYNDQCPADSKGPGGHAYAGCVPVAMGQLMYYYRWPNTGQGSYSYSDSTYGTLSADFGQTTYLWDNMTNAISTHNEGIGVLLYHLGVSCDLVYGPDGSGMYNHKAAYSLRTFFRYSSQTQYLYRDSTSLDWDSILVAHLERKMPLYYAGWSKPWTDGHAFVCDGYQDTCYFHFNFGWSGQNNGYFYTSNLTPGGNNFKLAQEMIINAFPDTINNSYPQNCTGTKTCTFMTGSMEDGSGPVENYQPGSHCTWIIDPQPAYDSVSEITLTINRFSIAATDTLKVYNGLQPGAALVASLSGDTLPPALKVNGNKIRITFHSAGSSTAPGFMATWQSKVPVWCSGTQTIISDSAVISDGSGDFNYHNNSVCRWILQSKSGQPLTVHFRKFNTEPGKDVLRFYDMLSSDSLKSLSGYYPTGTLPDSVTAPGGKMLVIFTTNSNTTEDGWEFYYPVSHLGCPEQTNRPGLSVMPNPASEKVRIEFALNSPDQGLLIITDTKGLTCLSRPIFCKPGTNRIEFDVHDWNPGFYVIHIKTADRLFAGKLLIR